MKVEFETPKVERNVVITITESEAKILHKLLGNISTNIIVNMGFVEQETKDIYELIKDLQYYINLNFKII